jgi:hypothetical protein
LDGKFLDEAREYVKANEDKVRDKIRWDMEDDRRWIKPSQAAIERVRRNASTKRLDYKDLEEAEREAEIRILQGDGSHFENGLGASYVDKEE